MGTLGILIQSAVGLVFAYLLNAINKRLGVMTVFRLSMILYGVLAIATWWGRSIVGSLIIQGLIGVVYVPINCNPYVILASYEDTTEDEEESADADAADADAQTQYKTLPTAGEEEDEEDDAKEAKIPPIPRLETNPGQPEPAVANGEEESEEDKEEESEESTFHAAHTALLNVSMTLAQILVGSFSGLVIERTGDITFVFVGSGALLLLANVVIGAFDYVAYRRESQEEEDQNESLNALKVVAEAEPEVATHVLNLEQNKLLKARYREAVTDKASAAVMPFVPSSPPRRRGRERLRRPPRLQIPVRSRSAEPAPPRSVRRRDNSRTRYMRALARHRNRNIVRRLLRSRHYAGVLAIRKRKHHADDTFRSSSYEPPVGQHMPGRPLFLSPGLAASHSAGHIDPLPLRRAISSPSQDPAVQEFIRNGGVIVRPAP